MLKNTMKTLEFASLAAMQEFIKAAKDNGCEMEYDKTNLNAIIYTPLFSTKYGELGAFPGGISTTVDVILTDVGNNKIDVIKTIREHLDLGLKEAKEFADNCPSRIAEDVLPSEAENLVNALRKIGCTVDIK